MSLVPNLLSVGRAYGSFFFIKFLYIAFERFYDDWMLCSPLGRIARCYMTKIEDKRSALGLSAAAN